MLFKFLSSLILTLTLLLTQSLTSPVQLTPGSSNSQLEARAGPSGYLYYPNGGDTYNNYDGLGKIDISYAQVSHADAQTISINVFIAPEADLSSNGFPQIASGLTRNDTCSPILATFSLRGYCGSLALVVVETQLYFGKVIHFRSAAPNFIVNC